MKPKMEHGCNLLIAMVIGYLLLFLLILAFAHLLKSLEI
jgi:hypothetical protein